MRTLLFMFLLIACGISSAAPPEKSASDNVNTKIQQANETPDNPFSVQIIRQTNGTQGHPLFVQIKESDEDKAAKAENEYQTTIITSVGIAVSGIFAGLGLLFNYRAMRRNNRIAVSTKLAELSKLVSNELVARVEMYGLLKRELLEAKNYSDSDSATAIQKIEGLQKSMDINLKRQAELDKETKYLEEAFQHLDGVDIGGVDARIARLYRFQKIAESGLGQAEKLKQVNGA